MIINIKDLVRDSIIIDYLFNSLNLMPYDLRSTSIIDNSRIYNRLLSIQRSGIYSNKTSKYFKLIINDIDLGKISLVIKLGDINKLIIYYSDRINIDMLLDIINLYPIYPNYNILDEDSLIDKLYITRLYTYPSRWIKEESLISVARREISNRSNLYISLNDEVIMSVIMKSTDIEGLCLSTDVSEFIISEEVSNEI